VFSAKAPLKFFRRYLFYFTTQKEDRAVIPGFTKADEIF